MDNVKAFIHDDHDNIGSSRGVAGGSQPTTPKAGHPLDVLPVLSKYGWDMSRSSTHHSRNLYDVTNGTIMNGVAYNNTYHGIYIVDSSAPQIPI